MNAYTSSQLAPAPICTTDASLLTDMVVMSVMSIVTPPSTFANPAAGACPCPLIAALHSFPLRPMILITEDTSAEDWGLTMQEGVMWVVSCRLQYWSCVAL
jgi:hypothetical protein